MKEAIPRDYLLFNSIFMKFEKKPYCSTKKQISGARVRLGIDYKGVNGVF